MQPIVRASRTLTVVARRGLAALSRASVGHSKLRVYINVAGVAVWFALSAACQSGDDKDVPVGKMIDFKPPSRPSLDQLGVPRNKNGTYTVSRADGIELVVDPSHITPFDTVHRCSLWLRSCYSPPQRPMDDCYRSVPRCAPDAWKRQESCCPEACYEEYAARRRNGEAELDAWLAVSKAQACYPEVKRYLETARSEP